MGFWNQITQKYTQALVALDLLGIAGIWMLQPTRRVGDDPWGIYVIAISKWAGGWCS